MAATHLLLDCIEWLFDQFCNYFCYQLCCNIDAGYCAGNYMKRVMWTSPELFFNHKGRAPAGCVALSTSGNHVWAAMEYHHIPICFLSPASPTSKD
ncbi:hypothetical protein J3R82DRAFT_9273 [Butyriboletus roseoflavus]|nr:hypothetical protein J3R82DRAFT_9273 [Butyriboletus roseoflavus]